MPGDAVWLESWLVKPGLAAYLLNVQIYCFPFQGGGEGNTEFNWYLSCQLIISILWDKSNIWLQILKGKLLCSAAIACCMPGI